LFQVEDKTGKDSMFMLHVSLYYYIFINILFVHDTFKYISPKLLE